MFSFASKPASTKELQFIDSASQSSTSVTLPTHQAGDLIIIFAAHSSNTLPSLAAGYTNIVNTNASASCRVGYKIAASNSETSGTWSNAQWVSAHIYRGVNQANPIGNSGATAASSTTISLSNISATDERSWFFAGCISNNSGQTTTFSDFTSRQNLAGGSWSAASFDTNNPSSAISGKTYTQSNNRWATATVELKV
jgi:hypothetical protein